MLDRKTDRRRALYYFAATTVSLALVADTPLPAFSQEITQPVKKQAPASSPGLKIEDKIKKFEADKGMDQLTLAETKDHVKRSAELMASQVPGFDSSPDEISEKTVIIQPETSAGMTRAERRAKFEGRPESDPFIRQLLLNPDLSLTTEETAAIHSLTLIYRATGWVIDDKLIFLDLDYMNDMEKIRQQRLARGLPGPLIFGGTGIRVTCQPIAPAKKVRSTSSHEDVHYDGGKTGNRVIQPNILDYFRTQFAPTPGELYSGHQSNFKIQLLYQSSPQDRGKWSTYRGWNELATDMTALIANRIIGDFASGYLFPADAVNLESLINASELNLGDFYRLYRTSDLEGFYIAMAKAAQKGPNRLFEDSTSEAQLVKFAMDRLPPGQQDSVNTQSTYIFPAANLKPYYPFIDNPDVIYPHPEEIQQYAADPRLGCL